MNGLVKKFKSIFDPSSPEAELLERIDPNKLPRHIAVIMDGNGRWAKQRTREVLEEEVRHTGVEGDENVVVAVPVDVSDVGVEGNTTRPAQAGLTRRQLGKADGPDSIVGVSVQLVAAGEVGDVEVEVAVVVEVDEVTLVVVGTGAG